MFCSRHVQSVAYAKLFVFTGVIDSHRPERSVSCLCSLAASLHTALSEADERDDAAMQVQVFTAGSQLDATLYLSPPAPPLFERHEQLFIGLMAAGAFLLLSAAALLAYRWCLCGAQPGVLAALKVEPKELQIRWVTIMPTPVCLSREPVK